MKLLSFNKLDEIVNYNISSFLSKNIINEHYSQLELPFDGNILKPNYEYFIDYLEEIGKYGTLQPSDKGFDYHKTINVEQLVKDIMAHGDDASICDFVREAFEDMLWQIYRQEPYDDLMDKYNMFSDSIEEEINGIVKYIKNECDHSISKKTIISQLNNTIKNHINSFIEDSILEYLIYDENGLIVIEREICLNNMLNKPNKFDSSQFSIIMKDKEYKKGLGLCWCYKEGYAAAYNGVGEDCIILKGRVDPRNVDWETTLRVNILFNCEEHELRLLPNVPIEIDQIVMNHTNRLQVSTYTLPLHNPIIVPSGIHY